MHGAASVFNGAKVDALQAGYSVALGRPWRSAVGVEMIDEGGDDDVVRSFVISALALLSACGEGAPQDFQQRMFNGPLLPDEAEHLQREMLPGLTRACLARLRSGGLDAVGSAPVHSCFESTPPQRWRGLWRDGFEGSRFGPAPARACSDRTPGERIWLNVAEHLPRPGMQGSGGLYALDFIGRRTIETGRFGHLGTSNHVMTVERMISIRQVEAPPPPSTEAETEAETRRCEADGTCIRAENLPGPHNALK